MFCRSTFIVLTTFVGLSGCVSGSPMDVLTPPPLLPGQGADTGTTPTIGVVPQGQTNQLTAEETAAAKRQLEQDVERGKAQAAQNEEAAYRAEVEALQRLAREQKQRRLAEIESRQF